MTSLRSTWPSRLRQLLSSEGSIGPFIKLDSDPVTFGEVERKNLSERYWVQLELGYIARENNILSFTTMNNVIQDVYKAVTLGKPPKIKAFIEKVIQCPLQDIAIPLFGFRWEYNKGNFHHWRPLLLHFDTYFKTYLSCRNDLTLSDNLEVGIPLPKHAILQILRVMQIILENCPNKSSFDGLEH
ncbi:E3 ubiquitin-protein ligase UPL1, partial [Mucuna pruriens]